jgi:2-dehydropantoate 2-reductase
VSGAGRFIVVGAGAIGASIARGAMSADAGRGLVIVADPDARVREAFAREGVAVVDPSAGWAGFEVRPGDLAIVAVRAGLAERVLKALPAGLAALCVCNGLNPGLASCRDGVTMIGVVDFAATCDRPGQPRATQAGTLTMPTDSPGGGTHRLAAALAGSAIGTKLVADVREHQWAKVILNASLDPAAALSGRTLGGVFSHRPAFELMRRLLREGLAAARAGGVEPAPVRGTPIATMVRVFHTPVINRIAAMVASRQARDVQSTMLADLRSGSVTETAYLNGAIARWAEAHGAAAPTHRAVERLLGTLVGRALEKGVPDETLRSLLSGAARP